MLTEERRRRITEYVRSAGTATVTELCERLNISESTVRRDLLALDNAGMLIKVHGGAAFPREGFLSEEPGIEAKEGLYSAEKAMIAEYAASTVRKNDFIYIDAGTTTERMIDFISERDITVVTNSFTHAKKLARRGFRVYIPGGEIKASTEAIIGTETIAAIEKYNFTKCYMGTNGISLQGGFSTPDINEAAVKEAAVKQAYVTYVLADSSKFNSVSPVTFAPLSAACVITDRLPDERYKGPCIIKEVSK